MKVLLLASQGDEAERIAAFCRRIFDDVTALHGDWGQPLPEAARDWEGDLIVSYCSRWIVRQPLLDRARLSVNFHPASPEYPGAGGLNWALYENADSFGATYHQMTATVDDGTIFEVRRFPVMASDDVAELYRRTHLHLEALACDALAALSRGQEPAPAGLNWGTKRYRRELDEMMTVTADTAAEEIARRIRAFEFGNWRLEMQAGGQTFLRKPQ